MCASQTLLIDNNGIRLLVGFLTMAQKRPFNQRKPGQAPFCVPLCRHKGVGNTGGVWIVSMIELVHFSGKVL